MKRYYCWPVGCAVDGVGDHCEECGRIWSAHREIDATWCGYFVGCPDAPQRPDQLLAGRTIAAHGHHRIALMRKRALRPAFVCLLRRAVRLSARISRAARRYSSTLVIDPPSVP